jgi:hypothetical protein
LLLLYSHAGVQRLEAPGKKKEKERRTLQMNAEAKRRKQDKYATTIVHTKVANMTVNQTPKNKSMSLSLGKKKEF